MPELPTGTVSFLFTDIEGSTARWEKHPEDMQVALVRHDKILQSAIDAHGGVVFSRMGDGMAAAFASARNALGAAVSAQEALTQEAWPAPIGELTVRMGVHTGEGKLVEGQYLSQPVNRCARLMAIGHGGQVLVSGATESLIREGLPSGVSLTDLGEHRLRDLSEPIRIFQVETAARRRRFPPLRSVGALPGNLPLQVSSLVGRERELARVTKALGEGRIVTLTGVGGVGKTRLALQAAADVLPRFRDGAWLVELAPVRDPAEVVAMFAGVFNVTPRVSESIQDALAEFLRTKQVLVVIDNCEHLLDAVGDLVEALERTCAELVVLATSREGLGLEDEQNLTVPSLGIPPESADLEEVERSDAVSLFVQRARRADAEFALTEENAPFVLQVCRRLDGVPLAIELAAAQIAAMTPSELAAGLDHRFDTLAGGRRRAIERHQTLRATIDWSYDLLDEAERQLLDRLAVFAGGCTREAAEAICAGPSTSGRELFRLLRGLVAKSLVVAERADSATRYRLLETIREYGEERLADCGETGALRDRHAGYYAGFLGPISEEIYGPNEVQATKALLAEQDNLVAALTHAIDTANVDIGMRLLPASAVRVRLGSALHLLVEPLLGLPGAAEHPRYPYVLAVAARLAGLQGDVDTCCAGTQEAALAAERLGDPDHLTTAQVQVQINLAGIAMARDELDLAASHWDRLVEIARSTGQTWLLTIAMSRPVMGDNLTSADLDASIARATEGLAVARQVGMPRTIIWNLEALAAALADRDPERAWALWRESLDVRRSLGYENHETGGAAMGLAAGARLGDWPTVLELAPRAIWLFERQRMGLGGILDTVARALVPSDREAAAVLQGALRGRAASRAGDSAGPGLGDQASIGSIHGLVGELRRETTELLVQALGEARLEELNAQGQAMDGDRVVRYALDAIAKAQVAACR